jgi:Tol biopolymer transport system component
VPKSRRTWRLGAAAVLALALLSTAAILSTAAGSRVTLVSKTSGGAAADGDSHLRANGGSISRDGTLAVFSSEAANLPQGDGSTSRCYVRNLRTGKTRLVSVTSNGTPATGQTLNPSISANGRFVGFSGNGEGLPGADPNADQAWVHDLKTHKTRLVSRARNGDPGSEGSSEYPSFSADGHFVSFQSYAANMPGATNSEDLVYIRDMERGKTLVGSRTPGAILRSPTSTGSRSPPMAGG